jgi:hypothetical protein
MGTNITWFPQADEYRLVDGSFTTGVLGLFYSNYTDKSGFLIGANVSYKNADDQGFINLPVVMRDYGDDPEQAVGWTGVEMDLKVGPRFYALYPQIGYVLGYRLEQDGFFEDGYSAPINRFYLMLPLGVSTQWPTRFGAVGFGGYYQVGLLNVIRSAGAGSIYNGGRLRYISFEFTASLGVRR